MTTADAREILSSPTQIPPHIEMPFATDAGRIAHIVNDVGSCLVKGVSNEGHAAVLGNNVSFIASQAYGFAAKVTSYDDIAANPRQAMAEIDSLGRDSRNRNRLLVVTGIEKLWNHDTFPITPRRCQTGEKISELLRTSMTKLCGITSENMEVPAHGAGFTFNRAHRFEGWITKEDAISVLAEHFKIDEARRQVLQLYARNELTFQAVTSKIPFAPAEA